jgi:Zn-dependent protease with chaperone function
MRPENRTVSQLDPFVFPSETKGRFLMLIVAALAMGAYLGGIGLYLVGGGERLRREADESVGAAQEELKIFSGNLETVILELFDMGSKELETLSASRIEFFRRRLIDRLPWVLVPAGAMLFVATGALVLYRRHPRRIRERCGTGPLSREEAPRVMAEIEDLCSREGIAPPGLEVRPGLAQGHAFGLPGREVLLLHGGPKELESAWGDSLRVIAFHELGHIANGDAQEREKARAVWLAFLALLGGTVFLLGPFIGLRPAGRIAGIFMATIAVLWMIRVGLIRIRELYADWRVAAWGAGAALEKTLALPEREAGWWERSGWWWRAWERWGERSWWRGAGRVGEGVWRGWRRLWRAHPPARERREALRDPSRLFAITADLPFLTGYLLALIVSPSFLLVGDLVLGTTAVAFLISSPLLSAAAGMVPGPARTVLIASTVGIHFILPFLIVTGFLLLLSVLATKTLGVQVQRRAVADLAAGRSGREGILGLLRPALLFTFGMEAGFWLAPGSPFALGFSAELAVLLVWLPGVTILVWLWLAYAYTLSRSLLGAHASRENPRRRRSFVTLASAGVLMILFWPVALTRLAILIWLRRGAIPYQESGLDPTMVPRILFLVLFFAVAACAFCVGLSLLLIQTRVLQRRLRCPVCNQVTPGALVLGCACQGCGRNLAPWAFAGGERW